MYPYHNRIKQRIRNGELESYEFVEDYPGIGECLVLQFNTVPMFRPIRPHRYMEYISVLSELDKKKNPLPGGNRAGDTHRGDTI
jgi:hypothetical protein